MIAYLHCIYCKVKTRIQGEECHKPRSRCASVWKMMVELFLYSLDKHDLSLTVISLRYGYLFSFFWHQLFIFAHSFLIPFHSHISFARILERDHTKLGVFIWWKMKSMFLRTSSVEAAYVCSVYVILISGLWQNSQQGSRRFDQTQHQYK
jgi:hypothetical protein